MTSLPKSLRPALFAAAAIALSAPVSAQSIMDNEWVPVEIAGEAVAASADVLIQFGRDGSVFGNAGCNNFNGSYVTNGDSILVSPLAATMMMCEDPVSKTEMQIFAGLESARMFSIDGNTMALTDADGAAVMTLALRAAE